MSIRGEKRAFKSILRSIASDELSADDYADALIDLRSGAMIRLLDDIFATLAGNAATSTPSAEANSTPKNDRRKKKTSPNSGRNTSDKLFDDVKRRKVSRPRLEEILHSIDSGFARRLSPSLTMREMLAAFRENCSDRQWDTLSSIINGDFERDTYLDDITKS